MPRGYYYDEFLSGERRALDPLKRFTRLRLFWFHFIVWPAKCLGWWVQDWPEKAVGLVLLFALGVLVGRWLL